MAFYIFHRHRVCLVDCVDLICSLYSWWEGFGSSSLATLPLGFNCGFISTSICGSSAGAQLLRLPGRAWVRPCEGQMWKWYSCLGHRSSGSTRYSRGLQLGQQEIQCSRRVWQQILANMLQYFCLENPFFNREARRPQSTGLQRVRQDPSDPACINTSLFFFFCLWQLCPRER